MTTQKNLLFVHVSIHKMNQVSCFETIPNKIAFFFINAKVTGLKDLNIDLKRILYKNLITYCLIIL